MAFITPRLAKIGGNRLHGRVLQYWTPPEAVRADKLQAGCTHEVRCWGRCGWEVRGVVGHRSSPGLYDPDREEKGRGQRAGECVVVGGLGGEEKTAWACSYWGYKEVRGGGDSGRRQQHSGHQGGGIPAWAGRVAQEGG